MINWVIFQSSTWQLINIHCVWSISSQLSLVKPFWFLEKCYFYFSWPELKTIFNQRSRNMKGDLKQLNTFYSTFFIKSTGTHLFWLTYRIQRSSLSPSISDPECLRLSEQRNGWIKCRERKNPNDPRQESSKGLLSFYRARLEPWAPGLSGRSLR